MFPWKYEFENDLIIAQILIKHLDLELLNQIPDSLINTGFPPQWILTQKKKVGVSFSEFNKRMMSLSLCLFEREILISET